MFITAIKANLILRSRSVTAMQKPFSFKPAMESLSGKTFQNNPTTTFESVPFMENFYNGDSYQMQKDLSENIRFQSSNSGSNNSHKFGFDSILSTPLSSPNPRNSSSTYVNGNTEDERESYCSNLLKFEIPESLDFDDFM
ncbi:transcription factor MYB41-like [Olea europaea subsp. europaea]|uniref:Transcription factor MYB41-like n=1 Tax=Olea europaea subsp. europaea TaxID=158383 RepID=A0A8S0RLC3_OLEEU|nr:transcription factor MYB41-like [Olea europaea subsp. europaea]